MKSLLVFISFILITCGTAFGQAGGIALFRDPTFMDCFLIDDQPTLAPIYVVHVATPGAWASQWMVIEGDGFGCTYVGEIACGGFMPIGNTQTGISCSYGSCLPSDILVATINYFCQGLTPSCAYLEVVPDDDAPTGTIEIIDCNMIKLAGYGGRLYVNPDGTCECWGRPSPVESSSWGSVKALYQ